VDDLALVRVAPALEGVEPVPLHRGRDELGRSVRFFGRGGQGTGRAGLLGDDGKLRGATNTVSEVVPRWLVFDFDEPAGASDLEGISGPGDSGGAALIEVAGSWAIAGVSSWQARGEAAGEGRYGVREHYARVSSYQSWIDATLTGGERDCLALTHALIFDGRRRRPLVDGAILVRGERIEAVTTTAAARDRCSAGIDLRGRSVIPGLIDSHVHVLTRLPEIDLTARLAAGVTTVVDAATRGELLLRRDPEAAPRRFASGPILTAPGGYPILHNDEASAISIDGAEKARHSVTELAAGGADFIKVAIEAGFTADLGAAESWPVLNEGELRAIVGAATRHGLPVRAHLTQPGELALALRTGVGGAMHLPLSDLPDELVSRAVERGFWFVTTAAMWEADAEVYAAVCRNVGRLADRGARLVAGTDAPGFYHQAGLSKELGRLVECGLSPREALIAATRAAAEGLGLDLGTLEPGQLADLVVLAGRPWERIEALEDPWLVIVGGRRVSGPAAE
jgi:enamidase